MEREVWSVLDVARLGGVCEWCFAVAEREEGYEEEDEVEVKLRKCGGCGVVKFCGEVSWEYFFVLKHACG